MARSHKPSNFLSQDESGQIARAISSAEKNTTAEIKLLIVRFCWNNIAVKAARLFKKLNLHKTNDRNCVLVMLVSSNREFIIFGDRGIHEQVGVEFWKQARNKMLENFKEDEFGKGLCQGIAMIGEQLKAHFPYKASDSDEISNGIEYED